MEHVYGAAGAAFGYMHNNWKGAVQGYKIAKRQYRLTRKNSMAGNRSHTPTRNTVRRTSVVPVTPASSARSRSVSRGRRTTRSHSSGMRTSVSRSRSSVTSGATTRHGFDSGKFHSKSVSFKSKKHGIKVSKGFVKKVSAALIKKAPEGHYFETCTDSMFNTVDNIQNVQTFPYKFSSNTIQGLLFDPVSVLQAASCLFNKFDATLVKLNTNAGQFSDKNVVIDVKNAYATFYLKNNGQRTLHIDIYDCAFKGIPPVAPNINTLWAQCLTDDYNNGINVNNFGINTLHVTPSMSPEFMRRMKFEKRTIVLDPGQTHQFILPGPKNQRYDFSKFWRDTVFVNLQPMVRTVMAVVKTDLIASYTGTAPRVKDTIGRLAEDGLNGVNGLLIESTIHYHIAMPEQAGFVYPASTALGVSQALTNRHKARYVFNAMVASAVGSKALRFDEENPITEQIDPS